MTTEALDAPTPCLVLDWERWPPTRLTPDRGVAALVRGEQVALFHLVGRGRVRPRQRRPFFGGRRCCPGDRRGPGRRPAWPRPCTSSPSTCARGLPRRPRVSVPAYPVRLDGDGWLAVGVLAASADDLAGGVAAGRTGPPPRAAAPRRGRAVPLPFAMDACVGCHSCEVACAEQNGLPPGTAWRRVGEIEGGEYPHTRRFHLSMSCNHCLDPACLDRLPHQRLREAGQRGGGPPRRRLHRLPVLHLELPVLGAGVPARPPDRHQVRHVPALASTTGSSPPAWAPARPGPSTSRRWTSPPGVADPLRGRRPPPRRRRA